MSYKMKKENHPNKMLKISLLVLLFSAFLVRNIEAQVINTCSTTFYDTGGANGNYSNNEDYTVTYCSDNSGGTIRALFKSFSLSIQPTGDTLYAYDGANTFAPVIAKYSGTMGQVGEELIANSVIRSTGTCLTFQFSSWGSGISSGWEADIYCLDPPVGVAEICGDNIDNDDDGLIDQADPDCAQTADVDECFNGYVYFLPPVWQLNTTTPADNNNYNEPATLHFSTRYPTANFNVSTEDGSYNQDFTIASGTPLTQLIGGNFLQTRIFNSAEDDKGFIITSDVPINVQYLIDGDLNKNLITYKGRESLGKGFRVGSQTRGTVAGIETQTLQENHFISVMATEDNTEVTFEFDVPMTGITSPHVISLDRGQSYLIKDDDYNATVSGALVASDKNISVISGSQHTPIYATDDQDGGIDHLVPAINGGTDFVVVRGNGDINQDYAIVVPLEHGTNIFINGAIIQSSTVHAGDYYEVPLTGVSGTPTYIRTSRPAMVYHVSGQSAGEVGMSVVPAIGSCRGNNYVEFSKYAGIDDHSLYLTIATGDLGSVLLNGVAAGGTTMTVPGFAGYSVLVLDEADLAMDNVITAASNFSAGLIGGTTNDSGIFAYLTSFEEKIDFLDPVSSLPVSFIQLDSICNGDDLDFTLDAVSCGTTQTIISISNENLEIGTASIVDADALTIRYTSTGTTWGDDLISVTVENNLGIRSSICLGINVNDLFLDLGGDRSTCLEGGFMLGIQTLTGGAEPYTYLWSTGETTDEILVTPIVTTPYSLTVTDDNGCTFEDATTVFVGVGPQLICNDFINISLNDMCESEVTADIVLEDEMDIDDFYIVELKDKNGYILPNATIDNYYIGHTLTYSVSTICGNSCWGELYVEDKLRPLITCDSYEVLCTDDISPDSIGYPLPVVDPVLIADFTYTVIGVDACGDVTLSYSDDVETFTCDDEYEKIIYRNWFVVDESGNTGTCQDTINVIREDIDDIVFPLNRDNVESPVLTCDGDWPRLENGYPSTDPLAGGSPRVGNCTFIQATYEDSYFELCGSGFKILRHWIMFDWCDGTNRDEYQIIKVMDTVPPTFTCPAPLTVYTDNDECNTGLVLIPAPTIMDNCSETSFSVQIITDPDNLLSHPVGDNNVVTDLPLGDNTVIYYIQDDCDNRDTCQSIITVEDNKLPFAVADKHTVVSIGTDGTARVFAETFDDGSFDNCGINFFKVRKDVDSCGTDPGDYLFQGNFYNDYVDFCCSEIGDTVKVQFLVEDIHGNVNAAWVEVQLNDKLFPVVSAPPNITISCTTPFDIDDLSQFGEVVQGDEPRKQVVINDFYNSGVVGIDGYASDNCTVTVTEVVDEDLDCGYGEIRRTFIAKDNFGRTDSKVQVITVIDHDPFDEDDIIWPKKKTISSCLDVDVDPKATGVPEYINENCASLIASYKDKIFTIVDSACVVIHRTWKVLDWCQYDADTETGIWSHLQIIYVQNTVAPQFDGGYSYQDTVACISGPCEGEVNISVHATDDCTEDVVYNWKVDFDLDGYFDDEGFGPHLSEVWDTGYYYLSWSAEDLCGNVEIVSYYVTVQDCKAPTPYCLSDLATVIMPINGEIEIWASDFDFGSYDNCTDTMDLKLSFSSDTTDTNVTFTCDMIENGISQTFELEMWVTDEKGNQDFCSVRAKIQDNNNSCEDIDAGGTANIAGNLNALSNNDPLKDVEVTITSSSNDYKEIYMSENNGGFDFEELTKFLDYRVVPRLNEGHLQGVSTLDIIHIQKHILGLSKIENPYYLIASDINNSGSISAADLLHLRKLILGVYDVFPSNTSWKFIDRSHIFEDNTKPWDFKEYIEVSSLGSSMNDVDFMGVKVGDVNGSYTNSEQGNATTRSAYEITSNGYDFQEGDLVKVKMAASETVRIEGLQVSFGYDESKLEFSKAVSRSLNLEDYHVNVQDANINISYDNINGAAILERVNFIELEFKAVADGELSDVLELNKEFLTPELYLQAGETRNITFEIINRENEDFESVVQLYQNEPNPFSNMTTIKFDLPKAQKVNFQIFDMSGKVVYEVSKQFAKGSNSIEVESARLGASGIYYYQMIADNFQASRKMILTK